MLRPILDLVNCVLISKLGMRRLAILAALVLGTLQPTGRSISKYTSTRPATVQNATLSCGLSQVQYATSGPTPGVWTQLGKCRRLVTIVGPHVRIKVEACLNNGFYF